MPRVIAALHTDTLTALRAIQQTQPRQKGRLIQLLSDFKGDSTTEQNIADALLLILLDGNEPLHEAV